jgi:flavin reductase (DIM6/NTAB) family NADH-FMN oxidoreductase RutF
MDRNETNAFKYIKETNQLMTNTGLFLVSKGKKEPNVMTIGWGFIGTMWMKPIFIVAVRKSRYTYKLLEESDSFSVCLPENGQEKWLQVCGKKSGYDIDKFQILNMTEINGIKIKAPFIDECPIHFECEIIYRDDLKPSGIKNKIMDVVYPNKDMHKLYYGEIKGCFSVN